MKNISIWKDTIKQKKYPTLKENKNVDVLIIGGGITGVSTLYHLKSSKLNIMLVEQNRIAFSTTGNSTGKLNYLQNDLLDKLHSSFDEKKLITYIKSQIDAIKMTVDVINKEKIDCDLEKVSSKLYTEKKNEINKLKNLEKILKKSGIPVSKSNDSLVKSKYMIEVSDTYTYHPIKFVYGLLEKHDYPIYENTSIKKIEKEEDYYLCYTDKYKIKAKWVVVASHYPYFNLPFFFPIKANLEKSYLSASKYKDIETSLISYSNPFISIRNYKNYLIYLSNSHLVNTSISIIENYRELMKKLNDLGVSADYLWSNSDVMTHDGLPYIGKIKDNLLIGTGYNTWGLANGFLAGKILTDIILGNKNKYINFFSPKRLSISEIVGRVASLANSVTGYVKGYLEVRDNITYKRINDKDVMIYKDKETNKEYTVYQNCPHMGCKLIFNDVEKTWDCPCHGSRFDITGKCIVSPANEDISVEK